MKIIICPDQAAAADPTVFETDPLQPGETHLHSWMLNTSHTPVLDLTGEHIKTKEDIKATFHALNLCPEEEEQKEKEPPSQSKYVTDSDSSDDYEVNSRFKTSVEERQYNTIPGSATTTHVALSYSRAQANPTVERGPPCQNLLQIKQRPKLVIQNTKINNDQLL